MNENGIRIFGELCFMPSQARDARIKHTKDPGLKALRLISRYPFAWPGGYEHVAITTDGALLCSQCIRDNYRAIYDSTKHKNNDGWQIAAIDLVENITDGKTYSYCDHCGNEWKE